MKEKYKPSDIVPMIDMACKILTNIYEAGGESGISTIASELDMTKSGVYRALKTLSKWDLIQQNDSNDKYQLGTFFVKASEQKKYTMDIVEIAKPLMEKLAKELGESVNLCTLYEEKVLALESVPGESSGLIYRLSPIFDLYCSSIGKLFLSTYTDEQVYDYFNHYNPSAKTKHTITTPDKMIQELSKIREQGYSTDDEEYEYALFCVSAPIYSIENKIIAGISISGPKSRLESKGMEQFYDKIMELAHTISQKLGCTL